MNNNDNINILAKHIIVVPGLRGVGWAQMYSMIAVGTYYCSLMSLTLFYLAMSFGSQLPWSKCLTEWGENCVDSARADNVTVHSGAAVRSSAELYFTYVYVTKAHI